MNCQVCKTDKILMRDHKIEDSLPLYHTSIYYEGRKTKEIDIVFCSAKCSTEYYQNITRGKLNE